jgi:CBS-domain-containing membrane protein
MLRVADIMTRDVYTVRATAPLDDVAWALATRNIRGAPVRDEDGRLVGTLTKNALAARALKPAGGGPARAVADDSPPPLLAEDLMSPHVAFLRDGDAAVEAVRMLADGVHPQAVVIDADGDMVGIVTPMDVLKALVHGDRFVERDADAEEIAATYLNG